MRIILLGAPGSGKGTQSKKIATFTNGIHLSTGDILRNEIKKNTVKSEMIKETIDKGDFVTDEFIYELLQPYMKGDFVLDGFPRTESQAEIMKDEAIDAIFFLEISLEKCLDRIKNRKEGRPDDQSSEIIRHRFDEYERTTKKVVEFYSSFSNFYEINAEGTVEDVFEQIKNKIEMNKN